MASESSCERAGQIATSAFQISRGRSSRLHLGVSVGAHFVAKAEQSEYIYFARQLPPAPGFGAENSVRSQFDLPHHGPSDEADLAPLSSPARIETVDGRAG